MTQQKTDHHNLMMISTMIYVLTRKERKGKTILVSVIKCHPLTLTPPPSHETKIVHDIRLSGWISELNNDVNGWVRSVNENKCKNQKTVKT